MATLKSIGTAARVLKREVDHLTRSGPIDDDAFRKGVRESKLSSAGKRALSTAYTASWPGGMEFRQSPTGADVKRAIDNAADRLKKADLNGDKKISKTEAAKVKFFTPKNLDLFATEFDHKAKAR